MESVALQNSQGQTIHLTLHLPGAAGSQAPKCGPDTDTGTEDSWVATNEPISLWKCWTEEY